MTQETADSYVSTMERLQRGEPLASIPTDDVYAAATAVRIDVEQRLGRLNRFSNAREAMERVVTTPDHLFKGLASIVATREARGASLSADDEALMTLNAMKMLETLKADLERRGAALN